MMSDDVTGEVGWLVHESLRKRPRSRVIRYLALYVLIVFGVAGGILLANWITGRGARAPEASFSEKTETTAETDGSLADKAGHVVSAVGSELKTVFRQAAAKVKGGTSSSETGRELAQQCEDWRRAYEEGHTQTARAQMDMHCGRYKAFLAAGGTSP